MASQPNVLAVKSEPCLPGRETKSGRETQAWGSAKFLSLLPASCKGSGVLISQCRQFCGDVLVTLGQQSLFESSPFGEDDVERSII